MKNVGLWCLVLLLLGCITLIILTSSSSHNGRENQGWRPLSTSATEEVATKDANLRRRLEVAPMSQERDDSEQQSFAQGFLETYPNGDLILARLLERGYDLGGLRPLTATEAEARIRARTELTPDAKELEEMRERLILWPADGILTNEWLSFHLGGAHSIDESTLLNWSAELMQLEMELETTVDQYMEGWVAAISDSIARGMLDVYPYMRPVDPATEMKKWTSKGGSFFSRGASMESGWGCGLVLYREDYPAVARNLHLMSERRGRRDLDLRRRIKKWGEANQ